MPQPFRRNLTFVVAVEVLNIKISFRICQCAFMDKIADWSVKNNVLFDTQ